MGAGASTAVEGAKLAAGSSPEEVKAFVRDNCRDGGAEALQKALQAANEELDSYLKASAGPAKNAAFVFIKPHAVTDKVKELAKQHLQSKGITILSEGSLTGATIDEKQLIDNHYYAIAVKATIKKPSELNVPNDKFKAQFGIDWKESLDSGKVFNALDGCKEFGCDAAGMATAWDQAKADNQLVKLGGGFYCGKLKCNNKELYIMNGFFMSMRSKFTNPDAQIYYYSCEWDPAALSWADFRGQVLGPTDPAKAPEDSLRGNIFKNWEALGLKSEPNVGDNGMHASASPFEGFAERLNWLQAPVKDDIFGKQLLAAGMSEAWLKAWSVDPQVITEAGGAKGSIFDQLEDLDSAACLDKIKSLTALNSVKNSAFVFIKPHAVTDKVKALAKSGLEANGCKILSEGTLGGAVIDEKKLIDNHYYAIAVKATIKKPNELSVPNDKFKDQFGLDFQAASDSGKVFNALDGCAELGLDADGMATAWNAAKDAKQLVKLGGGFYCGLVKNGDKEAYIMNGFFMAMRSKFTNPDANIHYYHVEWETKSLFWADFRGKVLGPTDPAQAPADSLRGIIYKDWQNLGLKSEPNTGDNGMHASASPFEGFAERANWLQVPIAEDSFGAQMLGAGMTEALIKDWSVDPQVNIGDDKKGSIFDQLEDIDTPECLEKLVALSKLAPPQAA